jgi:RNA polymerase sigma-70 factor (ECF subfamily)
MNGAALAPAEAPAPPAAGWRAVLAGDKDQFRGLVEPHLPELTKAAARELRYRRAVGDLRPQDLVADELVGETLARAWRDRGRKPLDLDVRPWLLGLMFKVLEAIVRGERRARRLAGISLEAPAADASAAADAVEEDFWEWYQPDDLTRWEDVIAAPDLGAEDLAEDGADRLPAAERQALVLRVEHRLTVVEIASVMNLPPGRAVELIEAARRRLGR